MLEMSSDKARMLVKSYDEARTLGKSDLLPLNVTLAFYIKQIVAKIGTNQRNKM